jgi:TolB-like protein
LAGPTPEQIREQLQRILGSSLFSGARRLSQFLQFVTARSIEGQGAELKESLIGVEVYGRNPSYDPRDDSIVRAEASRLRAKLREYYDTSGRNDPIRIELPKGSYTPAFQPNSSNGVPGPKPEPEPPLRQTFRLQWPAGAVVLVMLGVIAGVWWPIHGGRKIRSIAVMTPANLDSSRTNDALGDAFADEITAALVDSSEWKVAGRAPAVDPTGRDQILASLRQNLRPDVVLTGSYRVGENSMVRLSLQLVDAADGYLLWTQTYHRRLTFLAESQRELVRAIVADFTEKTRTASPARRGRNPANERARKSYAQARELWSKYTGQSLEQSLPLFRQSIQADPDFALAWAGLADACNRLADMRGQPFAARVAESRSAAANAVALDDSNAEAHCVLGQILLFKDRDFQGGAKELERAVELDPLRVFPNVYYSQALTILGDFDGAEAAVEAARARLPPIPEVLFQQGSVFFLARRFEKLEALGRRLIALEPNGATGHWLVGLSLEARGRVAEALGEFQTGLQQSPKDLRTLCALSHAYGLAGNKAQAVETMRRFIDPDQKEIKLHAMYYCAALTYTAMNQKDKALEWLERAHMGQDYSFPFFPYDFRFDPLKRDPRYNALADSLKKRG